MTELPHLLAVGDMIELAGGYDYDPAWLGGKPLIRGRVMDLIPGQNSQPAVVVKLVEPLSVNDVTGDIVILELRNAGAAWDAAGTVHVELCDFYPAPQRWQDRQQGSWVESHASYKRVVPQSYKRIGTTEKMALALIIAIALSATVAVSWVFIGLWDYAANHHPPGR